MTIAVRQKVDPYAAWNSRITVTNAKCKVCGDKFNADHLVQGERLRTVGICHTCDFWIEKWQMRDDENVARINGQHYMFGNHMQDYVVDPADTLETIVANWKAPKKQGLGMGGDKIIIKFNDGRIVITNDLWHQGTIPELFSNALPNNAEMMRV